MEQPQPLNAQPLSQCPYFYVQSVPCDIVLGPYIISLRKLDYFEAISMEYCTPLVLDLLDRRLIFQCDHDLQPDDPVNVLLPEILTDQFSTLGLPQDCVNLLVNEISSVAIGNAPLITTYVSVSLSLDTALRFKRATEESIEALEMVGAAELDDYCKDSCTICFENLDAEMARMPCAHVYHKECVVEWLRTSHVCPLCRYEMPVMEAFSSS